MYWIIGDIRVVDSIRHMTKRTKTYVCLLGTAFVLAALFSSCGEKENLTPNPNNPPVQILPEKAFTITVCEEEPGVEADSTYRFFAELSGNKSGGGAPDGKVTFTKVCGVDKNGGNKKIFNTTPDEMELVLTPWNSISFEFTADVNAFSSTDVIDVKKTSDLKHYVLTAKKSGGNIDTGWGGEGRGRTVQSLEEGYSEISFWNGDRETAVVIRVRTANHIDVEGFEFALDGKKYMLVEQPVKTVGKDLSGDCYLCSLPCISRPMEEYYKKGKTDYKPEDIFYVQEFSTIEFLGTVPRNATPDNKVAQHVDALSFKVAEFSGEYAMPYYWNESNYPEFRWMPFCEMSRTNSYDYPSALMNNYKVPMYPADLRARKGKIFNVVLRERKDYYYVQNYYFRYTTGNEQRAWWGLIQNLLYGQNPN